MRNVGVDLVQFGGIGFITRTDLRFGFVISLDLTDVSVMLLSLKFF